MDAQIRDVHGKVKRIVELREEGTSAEDAFTSYMLETLSERGAIENGVAVRTRLDTPALRCDGYGIANSGDVIYLVASHFVADAEPQRMDRETVRELADGLSTYAAFLYAKRASQLEEGSEQREAAQAIQDAMSPTTRLRCIILTNRLVTITPRSLPTSNGLSVAVEGWGLEQIASTLAASSRPDEIEVDLVRMLGLPLPCLAAPGGGKAMRVYTAILPGTLIADLYESYNQRILETNVRSFLRQTTKTNRGLRKSIRDEPDRFMAYNNGIVLTASAADVVEQAGGTSIRSLRGIQIVNGGQTTASLYMSRANDKSDLSLVSVTAKIVVIDGDANSDIVREISKFANTQNAVKQPDLLSGEALMRRIEVVSRNVASPDGKKWFFERTSGQYGVQAFFASTIGKASEKLFLHDFPKERRFGKVEVALWQHLWRGSPHEVSKGGQSNFDKWMAGAADRLAEMNEQAFKDTISAGIVTEAIRKAVKDAKFPAYSAQITNYTVSYLACATRSTFKLDRVWSRQAVSDELIALALELSHWINVRIREYAGEANVTQATKQEKLWISLSALDAGLDFASLPETRIPANAEEAKALISRG